MKKFHPPSPLLFLLEGRALLDAAILPYWIPAYRKLPQGDGHPVLVLPGFLASSRSTGPLRWFLKEKGFATHCWRLGRNLGYSIELGKRMNHRVEQLYQSSGGRKVSIVGWSLGGVYAREIARELPQFVRQVITLGSPFGSRGGGTNAVGLYRRINGHAPAELESEMLERMVSSPPVPTTAIYSRTDGVVNWEASIERIENDQTENVGIFAAHLGLGVHPAAWITIGDRLAQPETDWRPFRPEGLSRFLYERLESTAYAGDPRSPRFRR